MTIKNDTKISMSAQSAAFKTRYFKAEEVLNNTTHELLGLINFGRNNFDGNKAQINVEAYYHGDVSSGSLPSVGGNNYTINAEFTAKKVYAGLSIEREVMKASQTDMGAFFKIKDKAVKKTIEAFIWNKHRILWGDGTGKLGTTTAADAVQTTFKGANATRFIITEASWKLKNWEENMKISVDTTDATLYLIVGVDPVNRYIYVDGNQIEALFNNKPIYLQKSRNNDPIGLKSIYDFGIAQSGNLYGLPYDRRWSPLMLNANGKQFTPSLLSRMMSRQSTRVSKTDMFELWVAHPDQAPMIEELLENKLTVVKLGTADKTFNKQYENLGFNVMQYSNAFGTVYLIYDLQCPVDQMWLLNPKQIYEYSRPTGRDGGKYAAEWFDDDGTIFLRDNGEDSYSARYGQYYENYIVPTFQGCLYGLAKPETF